MYDILLGRFIIALLCSCAVYIFNLFTWKLKITEKFWKSRKWCLWALESAMDVIEFVGFSFSSCRIFIILSNDIAVHVPSVCYIVWCWVPFIYFYRVNFIADMLSLFLFFCELIYQLKCTKKDFLIFFLFQLFSSPTAMSLNDVKTFIVL